MSIFNWDYFSFVNTDWTWAKRELIAIPVLVLVLCFGWMKMVRVALVDEQEHLISLNKDQPLSDDEGPQSSQVGDNLQGHLSSLTPKCLFRNALGDFRAWKCVPLFYNKIMEVDICYCVQA